MLHCGLHAVNALLNSVRLPPYHHTDLDAITAHVHARERELCPDGTDTVPQAAGNYPLETLLVALRRQGLRGEFEKPPPRARRFTIIPRTVVGFLLGTGDHYLAVTRGSGSEHWRLVDNGRVVDTDPRSPYALIARMSVPPRVVLHVVMKQKSRPWR
jgi:hypothetical protein